MVVSPLLSLIQDQVDSACTHMLVFCRSALLCLSHSRGAYCHGPEGVTSYPSTHKDKGTPALRAAYQSLLPPSCCIRSRQVLGLQEVGVSALALTSLTSKEDQNAAYKRLDTDLDIRLVYGTTICHSQNIDVHCHSHDGTVRSRTQPSWLLEEPVNGSAVYLTVHQMCTMCDASFPCASLPLVVWPRSHSRTGRLC